MPSFGIENRWGNKFQFSLFVLNNSQEILKYLNHAKEILMR